MKRQNVILLGAGGAGSTLAAAARQLGVLQLMIYGNDANRSAALAARAGAKVVDDLALPLTRLPK